MLSPLSLSTTCLAKWFRGWGWLMVYTFFVFSVSYLLMMLESVSYFALSLSILVFVELAFYVWIMAHL